MNSENKIIGLGDKLKNEGNRGNQCLLTDSSILLTLAESRNSERLFLLIIHSQGLQSFKKGT